MGERQSDLLALELRCDSAAPGHVRTALSEVDGLEWQLGDAMLIASELVTNALRHSACEEDDSIWVSVRRADDGLVISVHDPGLSGQTAQVRPPGEFNEGGVGLWLIEQLSRRWGDERPNGYRVWAEVPLAG